MIDLETPVVKGHHAGTHRLMPPSETFAGAKAFAPLMGITRVANVTGLDRIGIPVVSVMRPNARSVSVSQGKGLTLDAARASGLMEAIELYHAETITLPLRHGSYEELRYQFPLVDVRRLPRRRTGTFSRHKPIYWIEGYDLIRQSSKWLPYEMVHCNYSYPPVTGDPSFIMTSNGLASGNHVLEAIEHGINELVERDAITLWHHRPKDERIQTLLDLSTVDSEACQWLFQKLDAANMDVYVWEQPSDIRLTTFRCEIHERVSDRFRKRQKFSGYGTHLSREIAMIRAVTEAAQSRLTIISGARDDIPQMAYEDPALSTAQQEYVDEFTTFKPIRRFSDMPSYEHATFNEDVLKQLELLQAADLNEVIVVDLTRQPFNLPVVRVVIPGLEATIEIGSEYTAGKRALQILERVS
jgi:YcaO-like protein with predicted kinase domain